MTAQRKECVYHRIFQRIHVHLSVARGGLAMFTTRQGSGQRIQPPLGVLKKQESEKIWADTKLLLAWVVCLEGTQLPVQMRKLGVQLSAKRQHIVTVIFLVAHIYQEIGHWPPTKSRYHSRHVRIALTKISLSHHVCSHQRRALNFISEYMVYILSFFKANTNTAPARRYFHKEV